MPFSRPSSSVDAQVSTKVPQPPLPTASLQRTALDPLRPAPKSHLDARDTLLNDALMLHSKPPHFSNPPTLAS
ncbi:hypothetical protein R3P38DRAFT_3179558 [Favolaschia claudopus]